MKGRTKDDYVQEHDAGKIIGLNPFRSCIGPRPTV
jgi:hypothetical protein